ncbi:hypothetical protein J3R83DRAFT_10760 [Lanmaoa asiatica]|nr:hypothetical protein J3R83DRAFT_10760 [Lanmaoa asiatica]
MNKLSARQAKRAAKAAERREQSEALREEGNTFFRKSDYQNAVDRYRQAIRVHGPSIKPILLTNLAAAYHNLGMFREAHDAADDALAADPKSVKARYRRAMARKNMEMWGAAATDFRIILRLDPRYQEVKKELAYVEKCHRENMTMEEENMDTCSEDEAPAPDDDPELGESLSESSDCDHVGNGKPCKAYNHTECTKGGACPFSHAPDDQSERDALGRNVCRYYLMDLCKFGERCSYSHSKEYLLKKGWWSTAEGVNKAKNLYKVQQMFKKAAIDYEKQSKTPQIPETGPAPKKKCPKRKKKRDHCTDSGSERSGPRSEVVAAAGGDRSIQAVSGQSSRKTNLSGRYTVNSHPSPEEYDGVEEYGIFGFTNSEVEELLCRGVKPWDGGARAFLEALHNGYKEIDALEMLGEG